MNVKLTLKRVAAGCWLADVNGVNIGAVNAWFNQTFAACFAVGIRQRKALELPELYFAQSAAHNIKTERAAVKSLCEMITNYFTANNCEVTLKIS